MVVVIMGVTGSGKTTVGRFLAERLGWAFYDADDFHPPANVAKMRSGVPLTDADREPWLEALRALLLGLVSRNAVLACSALRRDFRARLIDGLDIRVVYLEADPELIAERVRARRGHFMPSSLVSSQFDALEEPEGVMTLDAKLPPQALVEQIAETLR